VAPAKTAKKSTPQPAKRTKPATKRKPVAKRGAKSDQDFVPYTPRKNEEYMNAEQKDHFSDILLVWKYQLMEEVDRTVNHMQEEAANYPDPADRASQEEEFSLELKTRDRERRLIRKIDSTIELIEQDDYGYCESCGVEIGIRRLEARPTATLCIDCKTLAEIREKQIRG
jgi:DnaK suppressor protein